MKLRLWLIADEESRAEEAVALLWLKLHEVKTEEPVDPFMPTLVETLNSRNLVKTTVDKIEKAPVFWNIFGCRPGSIIEFDTGSSTPVPAKKQHLLQKSNRQNWNWHFC